MYSRQINDNLKRLRIQLRVRDLRLQAAEAVCLSEGHQWVGTPVEMFGVYTVAVSCKRCGISEGGIRIGEMD